MILRDDQKDDLRKIGLMLRRWPEHTSAGNEAWYLASRTELNEQQEAWLRSLVYTIPDVEAQLLNLLILQVSV